MHPEAFSSTIAPHPIPSRTGTNFSEEERREKNLEGLLPPVIESLDDQAARLMRQLRSESLTDLQRNTVV